MDFESVLELTAAILDRAPPSPREVTAGYRYFVVDEFQDVNPLQKLLLDAWLGGRDDVCVVGDPRQTIYSFTGATPAYLAGSRWSTRATLVRLVRDYRSTPQVVAAANRLVAAPAELRWWRSGRPVPTRCCAEYPDEQAEATGVAAGPRR